MRRLTPWAAFLGSVALFSACVFFLLRSPASDVPGGPLLVYCGAGIRLPVEAAAREYEKAYGVAMQLQFGPSQTLLASAEASRRGDLYLPGDDSYLALAREKGLVDEGIALARVRPALAVRKGNPKGIRSLEDLLAGDARIVQANPEAAAVGKMVREALQAGGQWEALLKRTAVMKPTVNEVANDLKLGTVDAGFVWNATIRQYPELEEVDVPAFRAKAASLSVGVLRSSPRPAAALRFARFLGASDRGLREFDRFGFEPAEGDAWSEAPELLLYSGAMLRPAIEKTVQAFERREGVRVTRVYNGCGILVGQMKTGQRPDAYFACDQSFMKDVSDLFLEPREISINQLVLLVPKGNPKGVRTMKDLGKPGLRVGVGHEKQCALGQLTKETLVQEKLYGAVMKNVLEHGAQSATGDLLVNSLRAGALDAVIAYVSNAATAGEVLEAYPIDVPCALAIQPVAVAKHSRHRRLASRLIDALQSPASRQRFLAEGFRWKGAP